METKKEIETIEEQQIDITEKQVEDIGPSRPMTDEELGKGKLISGRPQFTKPTQVAVISAQWMIYEAIKKNKIGLPYKEGYLNVEMSATIDGDVHTWDEKYSGLRVTMRKDKTFDFYCGENSALGNLRKAVIESDMKWDNQLKSLAKIIVGKKAAVKTIHGTVEGKEYYKNIIQHFK